MSAPTKSAAPTCRRSVTAAATTPLACQAAYDDVEERDDAVDNGHDDAADAVNDSHDGAANGAQAGLDLWKGTY